ncbi:MAG: proline dehydrogenase family protein [Bacteroidetes bacterium]|nr:proline dehydrogenase family protein [Bacteroidota bacterium]
MISFENTEIAFQSKSNKDLKRAYWLFKIIASPTFVKLGKIATNMALKLHLPINAAVKATIFRQFCGGESIGECDAVIKKMGDFGVGTILDYSVEGKTSDEDFDQTADIIIKTLDRGKSDKNIPFGVFKVTGIGRFDLLEKASNKEYQFSEAEKKEVEIIVNRIDRICKAAFDSNVPVFIDAEESWIQDAIDKWAFEMMLKYNKERAIVFNTIQMYRHDRLDFLKSCFELAHENNIKYGVKLVRGAYMEKERNRAVSLGYPSPIQPDKASSDRDYNLALEFIVSNSEYFALCAGTHNEDSSLYLTQLLEKYQIKGNDIRFFGAQLLGMSDHISYNLAASGYNVAKYVPFGPIREVMPYLLRRADENTSVAGQTGRELSLIMRELKRRKL